MALFFQAGLGQKGIKMAHDDLRTWIYCSAAIFIFAVFNASHPQIPGGMNETTATRLGGNNFLVGTVFWPSGGPIIFRMPVTLTPPITGDVIATTDDRGQFLFSGLNAGEYSVLIDGDRNYEPVSQRVEVAQSRSPSPQTYTISIRLTAKGSGSRTRPVDDQSTH